MSHDEFPSHEFTPLLKKAVQGDEMAGTQLFQAVQDRLRKIAQKQLAFEQPDAEMQATVLVDDVFMQLVHANEPIDWEDRHHFFTLAARTMRRMLIDHARRRRAKKRGGGAEQVHADPNEVAAQCEDSRLLALGEALERLAEEEPRQAQIVEMRHFGGYSVSESAEMLGVSEKTVKNDFAAAKAWLLKAMG